MAEVEFEADSAGVQYLQTPPKGGDSGCDDGVACPGHGGPTSPLQRTKQPDTIMRSCADTYLVPGKDLRLEKALEESKTGAAAATPTMALGAPSREDNNRIARVGGTSPHARENTPEGA